MTFANGTTLRIGALTLGSEGRSAHWRDKELDLSEVEFDLLELLVKRAGRLVTRRTLSEHALGRPPERLDREVDMHISNLRRKLAAPAPGANLIKTAPGKGYQFAKE